MRKYNEILQLIERKIVANNFVIGDFLSLNQAAHTLGLQEQRLRKNCKNHAVFVGKSSTIHICHCGQIETDGVWTESIVIEQHLLPMISNVLIGRTHSNQICRQNNCSSHKTKLIAREALKEYFVLLEQQMFWKNVKINQLQSIPLITHELKEYRYYVRSFIAFSHDHFTHWIIDWKNEGLIECQSLTNTTTGFFKRYPINKLKSLKFEIVALFLRKKCFVQQLLQTTLRQRLLEPDLTISVNIVNIDKLAIQNLIILMKQRNIWNIFRPYCTMDTEIENERKIKQIFKRFVLKGYEKKWINGFLFSENNLKIILYQILKIKL